MACNREPRQPEPVDHPQRSPSARRGLPGQRRTVGRQLAAEGVAFAALTAAIVATRGRGSCLECAFVAVVAVAVLLVWHRRRDLLFFAVVAAAGTAGELVFVRFGVWRYANPFFLGIPLWFPVAFGTAAVIGARMVATFESIGRDHRFR